LTQYPYYLFDVVLELMAELPYYFSMTQFSLMIQELI